MRSKIQPGPTKFSGENSNRTWSSSLSERFGPVHKSSMKSVDVWMDLRCKIGCKRNQKSWEKLPWRQGTGVYEVESEPSNE